MGFRAALNVAYSAWTEPLTSEGRESLDEQLAPLSVQADAVRSARVAAAMAVPGFGT